LPSSSDAIKVPVTAKAAELEALAPTNERASALSRRENHKKDIVLPKTLANLVLA